MKSELIKQYELEEKIIENRQLRNSVEYRQWRMAVLKRDKHTCQKCGNKKDRLEAHHIKGWKRYKKGRFDINNGTTLCQKCHNKIHRYILKRYWNKYFKTHKRKYIYDPDNYVPRNHNA